MKVNLHYNLIVYIMDVNKIYVMIVLKNVNHMIVINVIFVKKNINIMLFNYFK